MLSFFRLLTGMPGNINSSLALANWQKVLINLSCMKKENKVHVCLRNSLVWRSMRGLGFAVVEIRKSMKQRN